ncbi:MAG: DUF3352 domain-containing protein [Bacteroidota bacterium]
MSQMDENSKNNLTGDSNKENEEVKSSSEVKKPKKKSSAKRKIIWLFLLLVLGAGAWLAYKFIKPDSAGPRINPLNLVPPNAFFILETEEPYSVWSKMAGTEIWKTLSKDEDWKEYGNQLSELEASLSQFDQVLDILDDRTIYLSGHLYRKGDYDYLFVLDMEGMGVLRTWLRSTENLTKRVFEGQTIYEKLDVQSKETLYFTFIDNYFVGSYTHALVEQSITEFMKAELARSFNFIEVKKQTIGEGVARLFLNYESLHPYLESSIGKSNTEIMKEYLPLFHSGFYFDVEQSTLLLEGFSNYNDTLATYLNVFKESGTGGLDIAKILPAQSSIYFSLGFDEFSDFYEALDKELSNDPVYGEDYSTYTRKTEKFLNIDLEDDFTSWIDDEVAVAQIEFEDGNPGIALVMKAESANLALEKMDFLTRQIRRKTPVKFRGITYKGYDINFLSVKGFFNLILGKLFNYFDRPYYTIINEYVIFSNEPKVLRRFINDHHQENTLANVEAYQDFIDELDEKHSAFLYLQLPLLIDTDGGMMDAETIDLLSQKRNIVEDFPQLAFSLYPSKRMYRTRALLSIDNLVLPEIVERNITVPAVDTLNYDSLLAIDPGEQVEVTAIDIELEDLGAKSQTENFEDGTPKYEVGIKNGQKHGNYFEYHETGELKVKGKYKNDLMEGTWKYYDENGNLVKRERYKRGDLR